MKLEIERFVLQSKLGCIYGDFWLRLSGRYFPVHNVYDMRGRHSS